VGTAVPELKNSDGRLQWAKNINRKGKDGSLWMPNKNSRVCNIHFVDNEPTKENPDPTQLLGHNKKIAKKRPPPTPRDKAPYIKHRKISTVNADSEIASKFVADSLNCSDLNNIDTATGTGSQPEPGPARDTSGSNSGESLLHDHCYTYGWQEMHKNTNFCMSETCLKSRQDKDAKILELLVKVEKLGEKVSSQQVKVGLKRDKSLQHTDLKTDQSVKSLTGIPSKAAFHKLFDHVKGNMKKVKYWSGPKGSGRKGRNFKKSPKKFGPSRKLPQKDELLLTLMKLCLGSTNEDLAQRFGVSRSTVSNIFNTWIKILANELKCLIYNPGMDVVKRTLPQRFKKPGYSKVRHIIDCTEIFIETPSDPHLKAATWSDYKHHNTAKILVSITPNGAFNFISKAWAQYTSTVVQLIVINLSRSYVY
jgi:hypothetical protein